MRSSGIEPFYFGAKDKRLLGVYQAAEHKRDNGCAVVLCYPMGREYLLAYRSFRQLANRLCEAGFPVLRFDFYGCGDSYGSSEEGNISQWLADLSAAIIEMRKRSGIRRVCLAGLRLGATLALSTGVERHDIDSMVLWNPVVRGASYLQQMRSLHRILFKHLQSADSTSTEEEIGLLGFRLTESMRADLEATNLHSIRKKPAANVLVIQSEDQKEGENLAQHLSATGAQVDSKFIPFASIWTEGLFRSHVPAPVLASIVSWIAEVNA